MIKVFEEPKLQDWPNLLARPEYDARPLQEKVKEILLPKKEVQKVINKTESLICFEDMSIMNRAHSLAYYELLGDASLMNSELKKYEGVTPEHIQTIAKQIFQESNRNTLYYYSK